MFSSAQIKITLLNVNSSILSLSILFFISFAKKNKQTNKQREHWQGHHNSCGQLQRARILIKKVKKRNIEKQSDTRKTTATYNKLFDETRDKHYYILTDRLQRTWVFTIIGNS